MDRRGSYGAIELHRSIVTSHSAEAVFATLCDLSAASRWLPNCTGIELLDERADVVGARLRYSYREFGYAGALQCSVVAFLPGQRIVIAFSDPRVEASLDFSIDEHGGATTIHHTVHLLPKSFAIRVLAGVIRRALPGRMDAALRGLDRVAAGSGT